MLSFLPKKVNMHIQNLANNFINNKNIVKLLDEIEAENEYFKISVNINDFDKYSDIFFDDFIKQNNHVNFNLKNKIDLFLNLIYQRNLFLIVDKINNAIYLSSIRLSKEILNSPTTIIIYDFYGSNKNINNIEKFCDLLNIKIGNLENEFSILSDANVKCNIYVSDFIVNLKAKMIIRKNSVINDAKNKTLKNNTIVYEFDENDYQKYFNFYYDIKSDSIVYADEIYDNYKGDVVIPITKDNFYIEDVQVKNINSDDVVIFDKNNNEAFKYANSIYNTTYFVDFIENHKKQIEKAFYVIGEKVNLENKKEDYYIYSVIDSIKNPWQYLTYLFLNGYRTYYISKSNVLYLFSINLLDKLFANYNKNWKSCLYNYSHNLNQFIHYKKDKIPVIFYAVDLNKVIKNPQKYDINNILSYFHDYYKLIILRGILFLNFYSKTDEFNIQVGGLYKSKEYNNKIISIMLNDVHKFTLKMMIHLLMSTGIINNNEYYELFKKEDELLKINYIKSINEEYKFGEANGYINYLIELKSIEDKIRKLIKEFKKNVEEFEKMANDFIENNKKEIMKITYYFNWVYTNVIIVNEDDDYDEYYNGL